MRLLAAPRGGSPSGAPTRGTRRPRGLDRIPTRTGPAGSASAGGAGSFRAKTCGRSVAPPEGAGGGGGPSWRPVPARPAAPWPGPASGWPSGLRRCVQVAVSSGGVGSNPTPDKLIFCAPSTANTRGAVPDPTPPLAAPMPAGLPARPSNNLVLSSRLALSVHSSTCRLSPPPRAFPPALQTLYLQGVPNSTRVGEGEGVSLAVEDLRVEAEGLPKARQAPFRRADLPACLPACRPACLPACQRASPGACPSGVRSTDWDSGARRSGSWRVPAPTAGARQSGEPGEPGGTRTRSTRAVCPPHPPAPWQPQT